MNRDDVSVEPRSYDTLEHDDSVHVSVVLVVPIARPERTRNRIIESKIVMMYDPRLRSIDYTDGLYQTRLHSIRIVRSCIR